MNNLGVNDVMLDTSFCIRLLDRSDPLHSNALDYFRYFLTEKITIHLSTIVVAEYAVGDDPENLPLQNMQIQVFDFRDGKRAGEYFKHVKAASATITGYNRKVISNDVKILAQIDLRKIDAIISKDLNSKSSFIQPLMMAGLLNVRFLDLNVPLNVAVGKLF